MDFKRYFIRPAEFEPMGFELFAQECHALITAAEQVGIAIVGPVGRQKALLTGELVEFNGRGELRCEALCIARIVSLQNWKEIKERLRLESCKTNNLPYDLVVAAALLSLKHHCPEVSIFADGGPETWADGAHLLRLATERRIDVACMVD